MKPVKIIIATLVICMAFAGIAVAEKPFCMDHDAGRGRHGGMGHQGKALCMGIGGITLEKIFALDLSDSQKTDVANILAKDRDGHRRLVNQLIKAKKDFKNTLVSKTDNEPAIRQAYKNMSLVMEDLIVERARIISELKPVLKKEQLKALIGPKPEMPNKRKWFKKHLKERRNMMDTWINTYAGKTY